MKYACGDLGERAAGLARASGFCGALGVWDGAGARRGALMFAEEEVLIATGELSGHIRAQGQSRVQAKAQPSQEVSVADPLK